MVKNRLPKLVYVDGLLLVDESKSDLKMRRDLNRCVGNKGRKLNAKKFKVMVFSEKI